MNNKENEYKDRINNFILHYNNDTLQNIKDYIFLDKEEARKILKILSKEKSKIQTINEIILKTGKILPKFSLQFNQYYLYDGNISYQNCVNIYKNLDKNSDNTDIINKLLLLYSNIYMKQKEYIKDNNIFYIPINLNYKQFKQLYYISLQLYNYLNCGYKHSCIILFILMDLYKFYLQSIFTLKQKKFFINIIAHILILELTSYISKFNKSLIQKNHFYWY